MQVTSQLKDPSFAVALENSWVLESWWLWAKAVQLSQLFFKWVELKLLRGSQAANTFRVLALVGILRTYNVLFWILNGRVGVNLIHFFSIRPLCAFVFHGITRSLPHPPPFFFYNPLQILQNSSNDSFLHFVSRERYIQHLQSTVLLMSPL